MARRANDAAVLVRETWRAPSEADARWRTLLTVAEQCARRAADDAMAVASEVGEAWRDVPAGAGIAAGVTLVCGAIAGIARASAAALTAVDVALHLGVTENAADYSPEQRSGTE